MSLQVEHNNSKSSNCYKAILPSAYAYAAKKVKHRKYGMTLLVPFSGLPAALDKESLSLEHHTVQMLTIQAGLLETLTVSPQRKCMCGEEYVIRRSTYSKMHDKLWILQFNFSELIILIVVYLYRKQM